MIKRIKYFHGTGYQPGAQRPDDMISAMSIGQDQITDLISKSFHKENIAELAGTHGASEIASPVEVDFLTVDVPEGTIVITVYNRGVALLYGDSDELRRLHRFFCVLDRELGNGR